MSFDIKNDKMKQQKYFDYIRSKANNFFLHGKTEEAYLLYSMAIKLVDKSKKEIMYSHLLCDFAMCKINLMMYTSAFNDLENAAKIIGNESNEIKKVLKKFPIKQLQILAAKDSSLVQTARKIIDDVVKTENVNASSKLKALNYYSEQIRNDNDLMNNFYERGNVFLQHGEIQNAIDDFKKALSITPNHKIIYKKLIKCYIKNNQNELSMAAIEELQKFDLSCFTEQALIKQSMNYFREASELYGMAIENKEDDAFTTCARFRYLMGDVEGAIQCLLNSKSSDELDILLFHSSLLMTQYKFPVKIKCESYIVNSLKYLLQGFYESLNYPIQDVPFDLWYPIEVQKACMNDLIHLKTSPSSHDYEYPSGFNFGYESIENLFILITNGCNYGESLFPSSFNSREKLACGLAYIQLVQFFTKDEIHIMEKSISSVALWLRLVEPLTPIFYRQEDYIIFLKKGNNICEHPGYYTKFFEIFKTKMVSKIDNSLLTDKILTSKSPEELYNIIQSNVLVNFKNGIDIFLQLHNDGIISFGLNIRFSANNKRQFYERMLPKWSRIMNMFNQRNIEIDITKFTRECLEWVYDWNQNIPLKHYSSLVSIIIFSALISCFYEIEFCSCFISPFFLQLESLISLNFDEFLEKIKYTFLAPFSLSNNIFSLPNINENLPTIHHRIQALLINNLEDFITFEEEEEEILK